MKSRAAVAWEAGKPLTIETIEIEGPKAGEVLVEVMATGICHTDAYTLSGMDSEGKFPRSSAMKGRDRPGGRGRRDVRASRRPRHPALHAECRNCKSCLSQRTNLCTAIRATQGQGVMPDGTSRFRLRRVGRTAQHGRRHLPLHGVLDLLELHRAAEIAVAKVRDDAPFDKICYIGCGVTTGSAPSSTRPRSGPAPTSPCSGSAASG
jgi:S-(hydroxymethyl)glutathione dehydrogenase/alcohol dehydrogenase